MVHGLASFANAAPLPAGGTICGEGRRGTHVSERLPGQMEGGQGKRRESRVAGGAAPVPLGVARAWMDGGLRSARPRARPQRSPLPRPAIWATVLKTRRSALQEVRPGESCPAVGCSWRGSFPGFLCNHTEETVSTCTSSIL